MRLGTLVFVGLALGLSGCFCSDFTEAFQKGFDESFDKSFAESYEREFVVSCIDSAVAEGAQREDVAWLCACVARRMVEGYDPAVLSKESLNPTGAKFRAMSDAEVAACVEQGVAPVQPAGSPNTAAGQN